MLLQILLKNEIVGFQLFDQLHMFVVLTIIIKSEKSLGKFIFQSNNTAYIILTLCDRNLAVELFQLLCKLVDVPTLRIAIINKRTRNLLVARKQRK